MSTSAKITTTTYESFKDLRTGKYDWRVPARILNLWRGHTKTGEPFKSFNLLLLDNKRSRIHAFVPGEIASAVEPCLEMGTVYLFKNFTVREYKKEDRFRCIHRTIQIVFSRDTKFQELDETQVRIDKAAFDFYDIGDLKQLSQQTTYLTDVIGVVEEIELYLNNVRNRLGSMQTQMKFHLTDGRQSVKVTLWDELAELLDVTLKEDLEYPLIIIIGCGRVTEWQNTVQISNVAATTFYINYAHHSVTQMRKMLKQPEFAEYQKSFNRRSPPQLYTIEEIKNLGNDSIEAEVLCKVRIEQLTKEETWWDVPHPQIWKDYSNTYFTYYEIVSFMFKFELTLYMNRYKLLIVASDGTGTIDILLGNLPSQKCIGKKAQDFVNEDSEDCWPDSLKSIEKKDYTMKLVIKLENIKHKSPIYSAKDIIEGHNFEYPIKHCEQSYEEASGSTYHLDSMSETN
ncbi:hypothetical protein POM88_052432 [Heracleum sosnowskyi]|uniref:Replication protein A 70 kDa DNA-binding subunit B/D first OB fold domain-containing protein n=1 Tax=Heracleum sosnowskyi TaxID=360622 RepID=A0AAD8LYP7_9APIA|nr:hypothetical protein POM88_052432 [Heracleum sosnowskyi]